MLVTTQLTSKPLKLAGVLCNVIALMAGLNLLFGYPSISSFWMLIAAIAGRMVVRGLVWWNHS